MFQLLQINLTAYDIADMYHHQHILAELKKSTSASLATPPAGYSQANRGSKSETTRQIPEVCKGLLVESMRVCSYVPRPISSFSMLHTENVAIFQRATLKSWEWVWRQGYYSY